MCDCYEDPDDQVEDFPEHTIENPSNDDFLSRTSDPRDFISDKGAA